MTALLPLVAMLVISHAPAAAATAGIPPDEAHVTVTWDGWAVRLTGSGWLGFVANDARPDLRHVTIPQTEAIAILDSLVGLGFFYLPAEFPSVRDTLHLTQDGRLVNWRRVTSDGGDIRIALQIGSRGRRISMARPLLIAPSELRGWFNSFRTLVEKRLLHEGDQSN